MKKVMVLFLFLSSFLLVHAQYESFFGGDSWEYSEGSWKSMLAQECCRTNDDFESLQLVAGNLSAHFYRSTKSHNHEKIHKTMKRLLLLPNFRKYPLQPPADASEPRRGDAC